MSLRVRGERPADADAIRDLITAAFATAEHKSGSEAAIVDRLRNAGALTVSLVAEDQGLLVGHIGFSPVTIEGARIDWYGLGPVAVCPDMQRRGIGQALVRSGVERLRGLGARGCVVLGDPGYYVRFGFRRDSALRYGDAPAEYFQSLAFGKDKPSGTVEYHPAFAVG